MVDENNGNYGHRRYHYDVITREGRGVLSLLCNGVHRQTNAAAGGTVLRVCLTRTHAENRCQTSDAVLELAVLGGVDERVDAAVGEHQHDGEVVEPAGKFRRTFVLEFYEAKGLNGNQVYRY